MTSPARHRRHDDLADLVSLCRTGRSWSQVGSRSSHPSAQPANQSWIWSIASGLASVAVPWELQTGVTPHRPTGSLILETDAYQAWLVVWPSGTAAAIASHSESHCVCVVSEQITLATENEDFVGEHYPAGIGGVLTRPLVTVAAAPGTGDGSTVVHVVLTQRLPLEIPWTLSE